MQQLIPELNLTHLNAMTDSFGLFQHAKFARPNKKTGYALDDNSRALIVALELGEFKLAKKYLRFIKFCQARNGMFHNKVSYRREKRHAPDIGDYFGRTIWACGHAMQSNAPEEMKKECKKILWKAKKHFFEIKDAKTISYCLMGCTQYYKAKNSPKKNLKKQILLFGNRLVDQFEKHTRKDWRWFEQILSYCNAKIPHALFEAYSITGNKKFLKTAKESFNFLAKKTIMKKHFIPIGQAGWCKPNGQRAFFDQQPIEAGTMTEAAIAAFNATGNKQFKKIAQTSFDWFFGKNITGECVYNQKTGGIFDGIAANTLNENQGAESILTYLLARISLKKIEK